MDIIMAATATTTPIEVQRAAPRRATAPSHRGAAVVGAVIACLLLALGVPRLISAGLSLNAGNVLWDVYGRAPVPTERLAAAAADLASAGAWVRDGTAEAHRGLLLIQQASRTPPGPERDRLRREAVSATEAGLAVAPGDPSAWYRLANLRALAGDRAGAVAALRASMLSGAVVPDLMVPRIELGLTLLPQMDRDSVALLSRQIRLTWVIAPEFVAGLSTRDGYGPLVQDALASLGEDEMAHYLRLHGRRP
jgi:hypothetical protein